MDHDEACIAAWTGQGVVQLPCPSPDHTVEEEDKSSVNFAGPSPYQSLERGRGSDLSHLLSSPGSCDNCIRSLISRGSSKRRPRRVKDQLLSEMFINFKDQPQDACVGNTRVEKLCGRGLLMTGSTRTPAKALTRRDSCRCRRLANRAIFYGSTPPCILRP